MSIRVLAFLLLRNNRELKLGEGGPRPIDAD
jgi:hypothetical protein